MLSIGCIVKRTITLNDILISHCMYLYRNKLILGRTYTDVSIYNIALSALVSLYTGPVWGMILYCTMGYMIALLCFEYFQAQEYVFYQNTGWTKWALLFRTGLINFIVMIPFGMILKLLLWLV